MPEPLSIAVGAFAGHALLSELARGGSSVSAEGQALRQDAGEFAQDPSVPISLSNKRDACLEAIEMLYHEHSQRGWDGADAPPLTKATISNVCAVLDALPPDLPDPEFSVEPDTGSLSIEWHGGYRRLFSISVGEQLRFAFASLNGVNSGYGTDQLTRGELPKALIETIRATV